MRHHKSPRTASILGILLATATACGIDTESTESTESTDETASATSAVGGDWLYLPGGQGAATWTWSSNRANLDNIYKTAWDTNCDGQGIYTKLGITNALNYYHEGPAVSDACSGGATQAGPSTHRDVANIKRVRVIVCQDVFGPDECTVRDYYPPP
jgi:hypothetical protein